MVQANPEQFDPPIRRKAGDEVLEISTLDELGAFVEREQSAWAWIKDKSRFEVKEMEGTREYAEMHQCKALDTLAGNLASYKAHHSDKDRQRLIEWFTRVDDSKYVVSTLGKGPATIKIAEKQPDAALLVLFMENLHRMEMAQPVKYMVAAARAGAELAGPLWDSRLVATYPKYENEHREVMARLTAAANASEASRDLLKNQAIAQEKVFNEQHVAQTSKFDEALAAHKRDLEQYEQAFKDRLAVDGSVKLWRDKAFWHTVTAWATLGGFIVSALVALGTVWWQFNTIKMAIIDMNASGSFNLASTALVTAPALLVFWMLKHIARIFIINYGLADDARQRSAMVQTYLALITDTKSEVKPEDRKIVLEALFRPSALISDDSGLGQITDAIKSLKS